MSRSLRFLLAVALWLGLAAPTFAASSNVNSLTASGAIAGTQLFYCPIGASSDLKCTAAQIAAFNYSLMSGDCTASSAGVVTCSNVVRSFSSTCPATGPSVGSVVLSNGVPAIAEGSAFNISQCGAFYEVTGTTTGTLPAPAAGLSFIVMNAGTATVTVNSNGGATNINNAGSASLVASLTLSPGQQVGFVADAAGTGWDATPESGPAGPTGATGPAGPAGPSGPGYAPSVWFVPFGVASQGTSGSTVVSTTAASCTVFWLPTVQAAVAGGGSGTIGEFTDGLVTVGTTTAQMAIYANDTSPAVAGADRPGLLLGTSSQPANTASPITYTFSPGISLAANTLYWACLQAGDTTFKYRSQIASNGAMSPYSWFVGTTSATNGAVGAPEGGIFVSAGGVGNWPSTLHGASFTETNSATVGAAPWFAFQFSSIP